MKNLQKGSAASVLLIIVLAIFVVIAIYMFGRAKKAVLDPNVYPNSNVSNLP
jgi:amino acid permease